MGKADDDEDGYIGPWEDPPSNSVAPEPTTTQAPPGTVSIKTLARIAVVVVVAIALGWFGWQKWTGHQETERTEQVTGYVTSAMQNSFNTNDLYRPFDLRLDNVSLVHEAGNKYTGVAVVRSPATGDHTVSIEVIADGSHIMWRAGDEYTFRWLAFEPAARTMG